MDALRTANFNMQNSYILPSPYIYFYCIDMIFIYLFTAIGFSPGGSGR